MPPQSRFSRRPVRLQLSRAKGFNLQAQSRGLNGLPARSVARPGPFGNPFVPMPGDEVSGADCKKERDCGETTNT